MVLPRCRGTSYRFSPLHQIVFPLWSCEISCWSHAESQLLVLPLSLNPIFTPNLPGQTQQCSRLGAFFRFCYRRRLLLFFHLLSRYFFYSFRRCQIQSSFGIANSRKTPCLTTTALTGTPQDRTAGIVRVPVLPFVLVGGDWSCPASTQHSIDPTDARRC